MSNSGWIRVEDRLPEPWTDVLVYAPETFGSSLAVAYIFRESGHSGWATDDYCHPDVTHWMPLPEPPSE